MWISRAAFETLSAERIKATEEARVLAHQNAAQQITMDWLRVRNEQVERERAQLLWQYVGIKTQIPIAVAAPKSPDDVLSGGNAFEDIGDAAAAAAGIDWNLDGTLASH